MKKFRILFALILIIYSGTLFAQSTGFKKHIVQKGETLYAISRKYNVSVDEICDANNLAKNDIIKTGQSLLIPVKSSSTQSSNKLPEPAKVTMPEKTDTYIVKSGDTLYSIAKRFDISVDILKILNQMSGNIIQVGQKIIVPQILDTLVVKNPDVEKDTNSFNASNVSQIIDPRQIDKNKTASTTLVWPVKPLEVSYIKGKICGVLLTGKKSENVTAIKDGTVMFSGIYRGFGQVVFVQSSNELMYVYTGLESINVKKGQKISFGHTVGNLGIDMHSGKPQLNFMVFKNGKPIDPAKAPRG
ncbi:MAG: M23 family metallopeptidase [Treponema sp.]|nr:M23 family metallopeptidase [Treponema sp.]